MEMILGNEKMPEEFNKLLRLSRYRSALKETIVGLSGIIDLIDATDKQESQEDKIEHGFDRACVENTMSVSKAILENINSHKLDRLIGSLRVRDQGIHDDVFGVYRYWYPDSKIWSLQFEDMSPRHVNRAEIEIFWAAIAVFSPVLDCKPEDLFIVVLTHELAHAFTQLGADIEGFRWPVHRFDQADLEVVEGLAQYYTHRVLDRLRIDNPTQYQAAFETFENVQKFQPTEYRSHLEWTKESENRPEQEAVRSAMLQFRRHKCRKLMELKEYVNAELKRLSLVDSVN